MDATMQDFYNRFPALYHTFNSLEVYQTPYVTDECKMDMVKAAIEHLTDIVRKYDVPTEDDSSETEPRCVHTYMYLLLNTSFKCQYDFMKDPTKQPLVGIFQPSLSLFMFLEVVQELEFEMIYAESLLHLPLDLCVELVIAAGTFIRKLHYERRLNFIIRLISCCHKRFMIIARYSTESLDFCGSLNRLFAYTQQLITMLTNDNLLSLKGLTDLKKSENVALLIKGILSLTSKCLKHETEDVLPSPEMASMYRLSFGTRFSDESGALLRQICMLNQEFLHIIIKRIREIDVLGHVYNMWNMMESPESPLVTLQQSVRSDFYHFWELLKGYDYLRRRDCVAELFRQFNPQPLPAEVRLHLDLSGLSSPSEEERKKCMKDLMKRYKEWNHSTIFVVRKHRHLLDKYDVTNLSRYLAFILPKLGHNDHKTRVAKTFRTVIYDRTKSVLAKYSHRTYRYVVQARVRCLVPWWSASKFEKFIADGKNVASPRHLAMTLSYAINDPFGVGTLIAKSAIGGTVNKSIGCSALMMIYPALCLSKSINIFQVILARSYACRWNPTKFIQMADLMMAESLFSANDIVTRFLSSWLYNRKPKRRVLLVVLRYCRQTLVPRFTAKESVAPFLAAITHTVSAYRGDNEMARLSRDKTLEAIQTTAEPFLKMYVECINKPPDSDVMTSAWESLPLLDRYKPPFWVLCPEMSGMEKTLTTMICMWAHDCFMAMENAKCNRPPVGYCPPGPSQSSDLNRFADDFLRDAFIVSTQKECVELAMLAAMGYNCFWNFSKGNPYEKTVRIFFEVAQYFLEYSHSTNPQSFACMMMNVAEFTRELLNVCLLHFNTICNGMRKLTILTLGAAYEFYKTLRSCLCILASTIEFTKFSSLFSQLILEVNDPKLDDAPRDVAIYEVIDAILRFANECLKLPHDKAPFKREISPLSQRCRQFNNFVLDCQNVGDDYEYTGATYEHLCTTYNALCVNQPPDIDQIVG